VFGNLSLVKLFVKPGRAGIPGRFDKDNVGAGDIILSGCPGSKYIALIIIGKIRVISIRNNGKINSGKKKVLKIFDDFKSKRNLTNIAIKNNFNLNRSKNKIFKIPKVFSLINPVLTSANKPIVCQSNFSFFDIDIFV